MARTRKQPTSKNTTQASSDNTLTCPECGKTFTRPASLGAHRNRAHGIAGTTTRRSRAHARTQTARKPTNHTRRRPSSTNGDRGQVNRDALLQAIFPNGVPAREQIIQRANAWLNEAEQLANAKQ